MPESVPRSIAELNDRARMLIADGRILDAVGLLPGADDLVHTEDERLAFARMRAVIRSRAGDHVGAIESLRGVAATWLTRGRLMNAADINALEAFLNNMIGRADNAIDHAATALVLVAECTEPDPVLSATVQNSLGLVFRDLEAYDLSLRQFAQSLDLLLSAPKPHDEMLIGVVRANITAAEVRQVVGLLREQRDSDEARRLLRRSETHARQLLDNEASPRRRVEAATMLATLLVHGDRVDEAHAVLLQHVADGDGIDDLRALIDWNLMWAWVLRAQNDLPAALQRAGRALEMSEAASDPIAGSLALRERSRIHELAGDAAAALSDLRRADDQARSIRSSRIEVLVDQIARRAHLEAVRRRLQRETEALGVERRRLTEAVRTDPLTGVGNRRRLMTMLAELRDGAEQRVAMVMIDVDRFKDINDGAGHEHGDAVLTWLADLLVDEARSSAHVCRMGGDEFIVVLSGQSDDDVVAVAESIRSRVAQHAWSDSRAPGVTVSVGAAIGWTSNAVGLAADADEALLAAKRQGRNCVNVVRSS